MDAPGPRPLDHALKFKTEQPTELAKLRILRAEFLGARHEDKKALEDTEAAIPIQLSNVEWYLPRSDFQHRLGLSKERLAGLEQGLRETGAGVLEIERVEALVDDRQFAAALPLIGSELKTLRVKCSWLIRRARARPAKGETTTARTDLEAALEEVHRRLRATSNDPNLLTERAQAHELLGASEEARGYYEQARGAGADDWVNEKIRVLKADEEAKAKAKAKEEERAREKSGAKDAK